MRNKIPLTFFNFGKKLVLKTEKYPTCENQNLSKNVMQANNFIKSGTIGFYIK